jgi:hypothetical protein
MDLDIIIQQLTARFAGFFEVCEHFSVFESHILNDLELTQKVVKLQKKYALAPYFLRNF